MAINTHIQLFFALLAGLIMTFSIWHARSLSLAFSAIQKDQQDRTQQAAKFLARQYRRRLQMSILIGCAGFFMLCGIYISPQKNITLFVVVWILAIVSLLWTVLIAVIDAISINLFYRTSRHEEVANHVKKRRLLEEKAKEQLECLENASSNSEQRANADENTPDR